jgi:hypothetical protein
MIGKTLTSMAETYYKEKDERLCIKDPELKGFCHGPSLYYIRFPKNVHTQIQLELISS